CLQVCRNAGHLRRHVTLSFWTVMHMPQLDQPLQRPCSGKQLTTALTDQGDQAEVGFSSGQQRMTSK
ncbi:MAG TPA: hypothetical protein VF523_01570, partial [Burkholderiales bacterium]